MRFKINYKLKTRKVVLFLYSIFLVFPASAHGTDSYTDVLDKVILDKNGNIRYNWASDIKREFERVDLIRDTRCYYTGKSDEFSRSHNMNDSIILKDVKTLHKIYQISHEYDSVELKKVLGFNPLKDSVLNTPKYTIVRECNNISHLYLFYNRSVMHLLGVVDKYGRHFFYNKNRGYLDNIKYKKMLTYQEVTFDSLCRIKEEVNGVVNQFTLLAYSYKQNSIKPENLFYYVSLNCFDPIEKFVFNFEPPDRSTKSQPPIYKRDRKGNWIEKNCAMAFMVKSDTYDDKTLDQNASRNIMKANKYTCITESIFFISQKRIIKYKINK